MSAKRIENDEAYERSLSWLVTKSIDLEDPLLDPDQKAKLMKNYDFVSESVQRYRRGKLVKEYPGLRKQYKALGWAFDELETEPEQEQPAPEPEPEPEPRPERPRAEDTQQQAKPASALADWLDDE